MMLNKTKARIAVTPLKRKRVAPRATRSELLSLGLSFLLLVWAWAGTQGVAADWPTHRGNAARTGNVDGQPGPTVPKVLWAHVSTDHYLASPVLAGDNVIVSALGAFNSPVMHALAVAPSAKTRITWTASSPYLKLPTVCAPAYADGLLVFGDGMHQTDGAIVHAIRGDKGLPVWQYPIPGTLVHLEGAPTVANGKVYIGGGNAGVICLDGSKLQLEGKPIDLAAAQRLLDEKWKKLSEKYEQEKKVDPDFAIPPSIDALPKPTPTKVWQAGLNQWHVDAPLAVVGNRVLVCSAFLEAEKVGKRALLALDASNGNVAWSVDVAHNPWAGATVSGDVAIVGSSNIRLETKDVPRGRGEVVAVGTNDGKPLWRREIPGGVVAAIAAAGDRAIFTATDGKVR
ncbi:MAG TPA: PQQ-binding-like beta-propeller repeat protein, partial [Pirellulaceae bacterium]|nr:PQQ-binding-like beta-propeller repeat protein [Pirellulaceae bacterium]